MGFVSWLDMLETPSQGGVWPSKHLDSLLVTEEQELNSQMSRLRLFLCEQIILLELGENVVTMFAEWLH